MLTVQLRQQIFRELSFLKEESRQLVYEYSLSISKIKIIVDRTNFIFMQLPQGKPDPKAPCTAAMMFEDERPRVKVSNNKNDWNCGTYAFREITFQVGEKPSKPMEYLRSREKLILQRREKITLFADTLPSTLKAVCLRDPQIDQSTKKMTKTVVALMLNLPPGTLEAKIISFFKEFLTTKFENFYDYSVDRCNAPRQQIDENFLQNAGYDPKEMFKPFLQQPLRFALSRALKINEDQLQWESLPFLYRGAFINAFAHRAIAEISGLEQSTWAPENGIISLITHLKEKGPMVVFGLFGAPYYTTPAVKMTHPPIRSGDVYYWPKSSRRMENRYGHSITITGAFQDIKDSYVFFVDPNDESDPADSSVQKIYIQTYSTLQANLFAIDTFWAPFGIRYSQIHYGWVMKSAIKGK